MNFVNDHIEACCDRSHKWSERRTPGGEAFRKRPPGGPGDVAGPDCGPATSLPVQLTVHSWLLPPL